MVEKGAREKATADLASRVTALEGRVTALEGLVNQVSKKAARKKREYTEEERKTIRARLLAGQEAARKRREEEARVGRKAKGSSPEKAITKEAGKLAQA